MISIFERVRYCHERLSNIFKILRDIVRDTINISETEEQDVGLDTLHNFEKLEG